MPKGKDKKANKKQDKTTSKKRSKPNSKQTTKQASTTPNVTASAIVPVHRAIPSMPTCVFGRNQRKPDELVVMDVHTRMALAAMPVLTEPTARTKIAVNIGNELTKLYAELDKAKLPPGAVEVFHAHIACAFEAVGLACLF